MIEIPFPSAATLVAPGTKLVPVSVNVALVPLTLLEGEIEVSVTDPSTRWLTIFSQALANWI